MRTAEKQEKRKKSLRKFHEEISKKARENEIRAIKSLECARHFIAR